MKGRGRELICTSNTKTNENHYKQLVVPPSERDTG